MPTNNLSLTLGPGREEGEEEEDDEEEGEETESARTKCAAQGRERKRRAIEGTKRWRGEENREIRTQKKTLSAPDHLEVPHSTFFLVNNHQKCNSVGSTRHFLPQFIVYVQMLELINDM